MPFFIFYHCQFGYKNQTGTQFLANMLHITLFLPKFHATISDYFRRGKKFEKGVRPKKKKKSRVLLVSLTRNQDGHSFLLIYEYMDHLHNEQMYSV